MWGHPVGCRHNPQKAADHSNQHCSSRSSSKGEGATQSSQGRTFPTARCQSEIAVIPVSPHGADREFPFSPVFSPSFVTFVVTSPSPWFCPRFPLCSHGQTTQISGLFFIVLRRGRWWHPAAASDLPPELALPSRVKCSRSWENPEGKDTAGDSYRVSPSITPCRGYMEGTERLEEKKPRPG